MLAARYLVFYMFGFREYDFLNIITFCMTRVYDYIPNLYIQGWWIKIIQEISPPMCCITYTVVLLGATEGNVYIVTSSFSEQGIVGKKQMLSDYTW